MLTRQDVARDTFYVDRDDADPNRRCRQQTAVEQPWVSSLFHRLGPLRCRVILGAALYTAELFHSVSQPGGLGSRIAAGDRHQCHHLRCCIGGFGQCFRGLFHRANHQLYSGGHLLERGRDPAAQRPAFPRLHWNFAHCQTRLWLFHWTGLCPICRLRLWGFSNPVASGRGPRGAQSAFVLTNAHRHRALHAHGTDILARAALRQPGHARHLWRRLYAW